MGASTGLVNLTSASVAMVWLSARRAATTAAVTCAMILISTVVPSHVASLVVLARVLRLRWVSGVVRTMGPRVVCNSACAHKWKCSVVPSTAGVAKDSMLLVVLLPVPGCEVIQHQSMTNW